MEINAALIKEIEADITRCESYDEINGSESLYGILVAKYSVLDPQFSKGLSTNGKATALGSEFDFRQELRAIAAKLRMWLLTASPEGEAESLPMSPKDKVNDFIQRGNDIKATEFHPAQGGFPFSYVGGPKFDIWMSDINIFNERYLKSHPLHDSIYAAFFHRSKQPSACDDMLGFLQALYADDEFWNTEVARDTRALAQTSKSISELLAGDILRCQQYISDPANEKVGIDLYIEITSRYDSIIENFGNGLYQYFAKQHFYDPEISGDSLIHNLTVLLNRMTSYQAQKYGVQSGDCKAVNQMTNKVFIVHGHDEAAKQAMARTLEHAGFEPIILHEQATSGKTIIEKIEAYTDVPFAVVLYTECDLGRAKEKKPENVRYRARQNVVFEHGYLIGRLGRERVCALVKGNVETPGDISGVVYIPMDDAGAWKANLAIEMRAAGLPVDMNKLL